MVKAIGVAWLTLYLCAGAFVFGYVAATSWWRRRLSAAYEEGRAVGTVEGMEQAFEQTRRRGLHAIVRHARLQELAGRN